MHPLLRYLGAMGFNPFRDQDRTTLDVAIVVLFVIVTAVVVGWALLG